MKNLIKTQHGKALLYFTLIVFINLTILSIIIIGIGLGIKGYISDTKFAYEAVTCCGSICSKCFYSTDIFYDTSLGLRCNAFYWNRYGCS